MPDVSTVLSQDKLEVLPVASVMAEYQVAAQAEVLFSESHGQQTCYPFVHDCGVSSLAKINNG